MAEDKPEADKGIGRPHIIGGIIGALAVTVVYSAAVWCAFEGFEKASNFGESFGGLNAVASALATIGVVAALLLQQRQLTLQREELRLQRKEMRAARREHRKSAEAQAESARAARAHVKAFGAECIDRFISEAHSLCLHLGGVAVQMHLNRSRVAESQRAILLAPPVPVAPVFSSHAVHGKASAVVAVLFDIADALKEADIAWRVSADQETADKKLEAGEELLGEAARRLGDLQVEARRWYTEEPPDSTERSAPKLQAS